MRPPDSETSRSLPARPVTALIAIALLLIIWHTFGDAVSKLRVFTADRSESFGRCPYQIIDDGKTTGTYFFDNAGTLDEILARAGHSPSPLGHLPKNPIPCGSIVRVRNDRVDSWSDPIPGEQLLAVGYKIDLNRASAADLCALPGIGVHLAQAIVTRRERHGPFRKVNDLKSIPGIGPRILAWIKPHVEALPNPRRLRPVSPQIYEATSPQSTREHHIRRTVP